MTHLKLIKSPVEIKLTDFTLNGDPILFQRRILSEISDIFLDHQAAGMLPADTIVYTVQSWLPVPEGTTGGLFYGTSTVIPGKVGNEYFMTKGHSHAKSDRAEFYWGIQGKGILMLMDRQRNTWGEEVFPGSLHYIGSNIAHRLVNISDENLIVGACWPSDAGHNYEEIAKYGFSARLIEIDGKPILVPDNKK